MVFQLVQYLLLIFEIRKSYNELKSSRFDQAKRILRPKSSDYLVCGQFFKVRVYKGTITNEKETVNSLKVNF